MLVRHHDGHGLSDSKRRFSRELSWAPPMAEVTLLSALGFGGVAHDVETRLAHPRCLWAPWRSSRRRLSRAGSIRRGPMERHEFNQDQVDAAIDYVSANGAQTRCTPKRALQKGREGRTPEKYGNDPTIRCASHPPVTPRTCSATADGDSAATLQAGGPGFDSPCLHPGQRPFPLDGEWHALGVTESYS